MDELAHLAGVDPVEIRLSHLMHATSRAVVQVVAEMSGWGKASAGRARGVAFCMSFGVCSAQVVEVADGSDGLKITGGWAAVDVGIAPDPGIIQAQVMGAIVFGLSAAVRGEITLAGGKVQQQTFWDHEPLRMPQVRRSRCGYWRTCRISGGSASRGRRLRHLCWAMRSLR